MDWDEYALNIAYEVAKRSKDPWRKVGAVILRRDNSIAAVGYNGFPAGVFEDWSDRDRRRSLVVHAEQNALRYIKPDECYLIAVTTLPCNDCLKAIASYGIKNIVYKESYDYDNSSLVIAMELGINLKKIT
jgi:dCMP deaminase